MFAKCDRNDDKRLDLLCPYKGSLTGYNITVFHSVCSGCTRNQINIVSWAALKAEKAKMQNKLIFELIIFFATIYESGKRMR